MNKGMAKIAAFSAAAISMGSVTGLPGKAIAACATANLIPDAMRTIKFFGSNSAMTGFSGTTPRGGGGHFLMNDELGGYVGIDTDGMYGLRTDITGLSTKVVYFPGGGQFMLRACRVGVTLTSFTCLPAVPQTVAFNSNTPTSLTLVLDDIASAGNFSEDNYVIHGFSPGGEAFGVSGITPYAFEKGLRALSTVLGKNAAFEDVIGANIDLCKPDPMCWA